MVAIRRIQIVPRHDIDTIVTQHRRYTLSPNTYWAESNASFLLIPNGQRCSLVIVDKKRVKHAINDEGVRVWDRDNDYYEVKYGAGIIRGVANCASLVNGDAKIRPNILCIHTEEKAYPVSDADFVLEDDEKYYVIKSSKRNVRSIVFKKDITRIVELTREFDETYDFLRR